MYTIENIDRNGFADEPLMCDAGAAACIGISLRTLQRLRAAGAGPAYRKVGKRVLYPKSAVLAYIEASTVRKAA
jgi:excisionase family DNA binding protein